MIAQLIFFGAVAVLIILLVRRWRIFQTSRTGKVGDFFILTGRQLSKFLAGSLKRLRQIPGSLTLARVGWSNIRKNRSGNLSQPGKANQNNHQFWQEEVIQDKPELLSHFEEGDNFLKLGQYKEAEKFFLMAATHHPKDAKVYAKLGLIYLSTKNYTDAIEALKVAVKLDKYNPSRHYNLALAYWGNKDSQRAIASIREAISLDPVTEKYRQFLEGLLDKK